MTYEQPAVDMKTSMNPETGEVPPESELVWWGRLDNRFPIEVHRLDRDLAQNLKIEQENIDPDYRGVLCVFDQEKDNQLIYFEPVSLAYGEIFGPDAEDVFAWQEKTVIFIDQVYPGGGEPALTGS